MEHSMTCKCGSREASFNFKNEIMPPEVIELLYCPACSEDVTRQSECMVTDNGWIIHYDMDVAGLYSKRLPAGDGDNITPDTLFDEGYATWRGVYPGDHIDSAEEREVITRLAKEDPRKYFEEMKNWAIGRMDRLKEDGWRKAHERE